MSVKNTLRYQLVPAQSLATSFTTKPTTITSLDNCSYQIIITTSNSTGTFSVQASNDYVAPEAQNGTFNPGNWVDLPLGGTPSANAANDDILIHLQQLPYAAVRLVYTSTIAGTGTCNIIVSDKRLGG